MMLNYNHLYYFYVTAKFVSVSQAAEFLHISQPSLSSQIKSFERSIDRKLFEKKGRKIVLTAEGEKAFVYAKKIFEIASDFAEALKTTGDKQSLRLRIGISEQLERHFIADVISPLVKEKRQDIEKAFFISSAPTDQLLTQLRNEEIDLLLTNKHVYAEDVKELATASIPVNLLISTELLTELKMRTSRTTSAVDFLNASPWGLVMPSTKLKLRHETDQLFQELKIRKRIVLESDIISVVVRAVLDGAGAAFIPTAYMIEELKLGLITAIGPKTGYWKHNLYVFGRKDALLDESVKNVVRSIRTIERRAQAR